MRGYPDRHATGAHHPLPHRFDRRRRRRPPPPRRLPAEEPRIRAGVTVSGVDVGNLTVAEAQARLEQTLGPVFAQDIVVTAARRSFVLTMSRIDFVFRADRTALRALKAGQAAPPAPDGSLPPASAVPAVSFERTPLWRFIKRIAKAVDVAPRDAKLKIRLTRMVKRKSHKGHKLPERVADRVDQGGAGRSARPRARSGPAARRSRRRSARRSCARSTARVITIDRSHFRLRLFKRLRFVEGLRRRRRAARVPDPGRVVRDPDQAGQPDLDRAELALGGRDGRPAGRGRRLEQPAQGALDGRQRRRSGSTAPASRGRSARAHRTAASA